MATLVKCPTCGRPVEWSEASAYRPFCSDRCRLIDLGAWLDEKHRIPGEPGAADQGALGESALDSSDEPRENS